MTRALHPMDAQTRQTLQQLEESLWQAETRFDDALMERTFAPDFMEFGRSGRVYRRADMFFGSSGILEFDAVLPLPDFDARFLTKDVAQVTYVSAVRYDGVLERANRSSIWSLNKGNWQLLFHQGTPI